MARFRKFETIQAFHQAACIPLFYHNDFETVVSITHACYNAGIRILEFTNRGDGACEIFHKLVQYCMTKLPDLILGAGSIIDEVTAGLFVNAGANFIIGPAFDSRISSFCNRHLIAYLPGAGSINEIIRAIEAGADIVKVFPSMSVGGPDFIRNALAPLPFLSLMPTGEVSTDLDSLEAWYEAGAVTLGLGSNLIKKEFINNKDFEGLEQYISGVHKLAIQCKEKFRKDEN